MDLIFSFLLGIILVMISLLLQKYFKYPSSIWLMFLGFGLIQLFPHFKLFENVDTENFSKQLLAFLPFLLMADVLDLKIKLVKKYWISIFLLAVVSVVLSIGLGYIVAPLVFHGYELSAGEIIFTNVACFATDPVAVISIFNMFVLPYALKTLVEGESLGNDGTAIVFAVYLGLPLMVVGSSLTAMGFAINSILVILGSLTVGIIFAFLGFFLLFVKDTLVWNTIVWLFISLSAFVVSEYFYKGVNFLFGTESHFHLSGIVSTIVAGFSLLILLQKSQDYLENKQLKEEQFIKNLNHEGEDSQKDRTVSRVMGLLEQTIKRRTILRNVTDNFHFLALGANALLFIYLGELIYVYFDKMVYYWNIILNMVIATLIIRGLIMALFAWVSNRSEKLVNIPFHWWVVLTFVGFQGGLSVVLSSMIPTTIANYDLIVSVILGNIVISTILNATVLIIYISANKELFKKEYKMEKELEAEQQLASIS